MTHPDGPLPPEDETVLFEALVNLRESVAREAAQYASLTGRGLPQLENLAHYLALRHHDVRPIQRGLMWRGLSSLGRLESRVLPSLDAVTGSLAARLGREAPFPAPGEEDFFAGTALLRQATAELFGPRRDERRTRIMVTLPTQAATDAPLVLELARAGMDVARINCAHDNGELWRQMAQNVEAAGAELGRRITVFMDIAGPKIRTDKVETPGDNARIRAGDLFRLTGDGKLETGKHVHFAATVSVPGLVERLQPGHRVLYNDAKVEGVVESVENGEAIVRVTRAKDKGTRFRAEKGLNFPDMALGLSPLTAKDESDLATVIECADMIGYSFVSEPGDIDLLEDVLARLGPRERPLGLVAKIERPEAVRNLPALIGAAVGRRPFGVMIARGDLGAELGFVRLAEMQEEILWLCEAASVPVIWATEVMDDMVRTGQPSRGEMTDAAMSARAECVMLNKGPGATQAVEALHQLLARMDEHQIKKTPTLRALKSW